MPGISSTIALTDRMTAPINNICNAVNLLISSFESMQKASSAPIDNSELIGAREEINKVSMALIKMEEAANSVASMDISPKINTPKIPQQQPQAIEWQSQAGLEVFNTSGLERFKQETADLNNILEGVIRTQKIIGDQALNIDVLPENAIWDIQAIDERILKVSEDLLKLQNIDVELLDDDSAEKLSRDFESLRAGMTNVFELQQQINSATENGDVSALNEGYNRLNSTIQQIERQARTTGAVVKEALTVTSIEWQSQAGLEVFNTSGLERFKQETADLNNILTQVNANQMRITSLANQTDVFPPNMVADVQSLDLKIRQLVTSIAKIENNPINDIGADAVNADLERLRTQLSQAVRLQRDLSSAMGKMDISSANTAYKALNNVIQQEQKYLRDNTAEQKNFNNVVRQGHGAIDGLKGKIAGMAAAYLSFRGIKQGLELSDTVSNTKARLSMVVDDGGSVKELEDKIFASAQRSRTDLLATADVVAKLGIRAGNTFKTNDETVQFVENLNKQFVVAGASQQEISSASLQLTQALGSGVLRGEELNSVFEAAPNIVQTIADYMGVPIGKIREMASDGEITADIVKNALLSSTDKINQEFEKMPMTFGQIFINIKNMAIRAFEPVFAKLSEIANSERFKTFTDSITNAITTIANVFLYIFNIVIDITNFIADNWSTVELIIIALAVAMGVYAIATTIAKLITEGFFVTLLKNPLTWIALLIGIVIALIYKWVKAVGGIQIAWLICVDKLLYAWDIFNLGFMIGVLNILTFIDKIKLGFKSVVTWILNMVGDFKTNVLVLLQNLVNGAIDILNDFIGLLNKIPGVEIGMIQNVTFGTAAQLENEAKKAARNAELEQYKMDVEAKINFRDQYLQGMADDALAKSEARQTEIDKLKKENEKVGKEEKEDNIYKQIANNVADIKKEVTGESKEYLKYMRDVAEREYINRFTSANINIKMTNNNTVNSDRDLDGICEYIRSNVEREMLIAAEGVH